MIPIHCTDHIVGEKGIKIKEINQTCKVHININTELIYYPRKEFRVHISGNPLQCKKSNVNNPRVDSSN